MLRFGPSGYSMRWYDELLTFGMQFPDRVRDAAWWGDVWENSKWVNAAKNSIFIGFFATIVATALGIPFVIITVTARLVGFDRSLIRAAANLGANPTTTLFKVIMPLILPGVISGALFAFVTSFDEVVVVLFVGAPDQQTIPRQMWNGIREQISPSILAVATILVVLSIAMLTTLELLRRRSERLRGVTPT